MTREEFDALKPGDKVRPDEGFTCMKSVVKTVKQHEDGSLWISCRAGGHTLHWDDVVNMEVVR